MQIFNLVVLLLSCKNHNFRPLGIEFYSIFNFIYKIEDKKIAQVLCKITKFRPNFLMILFCGNGQFLQIFRGNSQ